MAAVQRETAVQPSAGTRPGRRSGELIVVCVARIERLWVDAKQAGNLLDDYVEDERGEFLLAVGARLCGAAVHHYASGLTARRRLRPGQRHGVAADVGTCRRHLFDSEFHVGELLLPAWFEPVHSIEHKVVKMLRPGPRQWYARGSERAAEAVAVPVPAHDARPALAAAWVSWLHIVEVIRCASVPPTAREEDTIVKCARGDGVTARSRIRSWH